MEAWWISNLVVAALFAGGVALGVAVRRNRLWREAARELGRRRPFALGVIGLFVAVALLDSVAWVGGVEAGEDVVAARKAQSVIDRAFLGFQEKSYSAPFASVEFYGAAPLAHPGRHPLGTDILGRDVLYLTLKGARVALLIGGLTSLITIPLALLFGVSAGYFGGRIDDVVFFVMSTLASMPGLLLLIALIMAMGRSTLSVCIALAVTGWVGFCRLTRGETLKLRELDYVQAARALGAPLGRVLVKHVVPGTFSAVTVQATLGMAGIIIAEASLSFLGLGVPPSVPSWGGMLAEGRTYMERAWWLVTLPGLALMLAVLSINVLGDTLRDALDPRLRGVS